MQIENFRKLHLLQFLLGLLGINIIHFALYFINNSFEQYWFLNWTLNSVFNDQFSVFRTLGEINWLYYGFITATIIAILTATYQGFNPQQKTENSKLKILLTESIHKTLNS